MFSVEWYVIKDIVLPLTPTVSSDRKVDIIEWWEAR